MANVAINLTLKGADVLASPAGYLGGDFQAYRAAMDAAGARYSPADRGNVMRLDVAPMAIGAIEARGFRVHVSPELRDALNARAESVEQDVQSAEARAAEVDAVLRARGLSLYPFQRLGVGWLAGRGAAGLFDEMGLGKTIQALTAAPVGVPVVVICPAVAKGNWVDEAAKWRPDLCPVFLKGRASWRWPEPSEMIVTNYDILPEDPGQAPANVVVICDEAHALKNPKASRTRRFRGISRAARAAKGRVWVLTGTPLLGKPDELWHVLESADLAREAFGSWGRFCELMGGYRTRFGMEWNGRISADVPALLRRVSLQRRRKEVLPDLPTKTYRTVKVELSAADLKMCDEVMQLLREFCASRGVSLEEVLEEVADTKGGVLFEQISRVRHRLAIAKTEALIRLVEEREENEVPCVVFSRHVAPIEAVAARPGWATITGSVTAGDRRDTVQMFQEGKLKGLAATIQAGGVAITLTRANEVLFADLDWTPALNQQAEDRVCRIGQTRGVIVTILEADHELDRRVNDVLLKKQQMISASVEASAVLAPAPSQERVEALRAAAARSAVEEPEPLPIDGTGLLRRINPSSRRPPESKREEWAAAALKILAGLDPDHCGAKNNVGFNRMDTGIGHSLADQLDRGLTPTQWRAAIKIASRYPRQVGVCSE